MLDSAIFYLYQRRKAYFINTIKDRVIGVGEHMSLESGEAVKVLEEHIEILKHNLLFLMAERKPESMMMTTQINTIKRELDKAVQERMKLSQSGVGLKQIS
jgi:flagellar basal body-associated protein FliL